ncbi:MAG: threonine-phosphate decarboxylase CobD [Hyphomicrobium sp.]
MALTPPETVLHGGDLDAARQQFPSAPEPWIDLSTGINPEAYPLPKLCPAAWSRLPLTSDEWALREIAARHYGAADPSMIVPAPGAQSLIQIIPRLRNRSRLAILGPTYGEHVAAWQREGHETTEINNLSEAGSANVIALVNPDNPTGRTVSPDTLRSVAAALACRDGLLVVDEAFVDIMPEGTSIVPDLPPATIVLRSFGKAYGLAGMRLGFAVADKGMASQLGDHLGPWAVSGPALAIGKAALADRDWLAQSRQRLERDSQRLDAVLVGTGCSIVGGTPLFRLVAHPNAQCIAETLGRHGIHVRRFPQQPTLLRFGLPGPAQDWQRLLQALRVASASTE